MATFFSVKKEEKMSFGFDFEVYNSIDLNSLVKKIFSKKRLFFDIDREEKQLKNKIMQPPRTEQVYKMLSVKGGFSSIAVISYIAKLEKIEELWVSTFRIGKKHFDVLCDLYKSGYIQDAIFFTSDVQEKVDRDYKYYDYIKQRAKDNNWKVYSLKNHSKIILMQTSKNFYVIETSSNLNENPKIEHFNWENDEGLYVWYRSFFCELIKEIENR